MDTNQTPGNPWFTATVGLLGIIAGYVIANGVNGFSFSLPTAQQNPPAANDGVTPPPAGRFASALDAFTAYADDLGLDEGDFKSCMDAGTFIPEIQKDLADGSAAGIDGTPGFWLVGTNGQSKKISGAVPFETFKAAIEDMLAGKTVSDPAAGTPAATDDDPSIGSDDATVTLIEFTDYQCPFCARHFTQTFGQIKSNYIDTGKVKYVSRDFPLGFHQHAQKSALASECADDQGKFWEMHDVLFQKQGEWSPLP